MYLCGKGISRLDPIPAEAEALLSTVRRNDGERMRLMTSRMAALFEARGLSTGLDDAAVQGRVRRRHGCPGETVGLQERHVAQAFQEVFFERVPAERRLEFLKGVYGAAPKTDGLDPVKTQNDLRAQLMKAGKAAFVEEKFLGYEEGRRLILGLGGIPCYPVLADGTSPVCPFENPVEKLVEALRERDLHCVEFIPIRNRPEVLERYVKALRRAGLVVVAGTEHNTLDLLPLQPACVGGAPLPAGTMEIFWEGACVTAAHQFLNVHGRCGFVDAQGRPNPDHASPEERIAAFRKLGAAVIDRYRRTCRG
jgi:hypothetical protein